MIDSLIKLVKRCLEDSDQLLKAGAYTYKWGKIYRKNIVVFILDVENDCIIPTVNASSNEVDAVKEFLEKGDDEPEIQFRLRLPDERKGNKDLEKRESKFSESRKIINKPYNSGFILNRISNYLNRL